LGTMPSPAPIQQATPHCIQANKRVVRRQSASTVFPSSARALTYVTDRGDGLLSDFKISPSPGHASIVGNYEKQY